MSDLTSDPSRAPWAKRWLIGVALMCALFSVAHGADPVRIAHDRDFPPFSEVSGGKSSEGLAVDVFRAAAARAGIEVEFVPVPFEDRLRTLEDGRAQAYFPLAITRERRQSLNFSEVLVVTGGALFVRAPSVPPEDLAALAGKIVVSPRTGPLAPFIEKNAPAVKLVVTKDYEDALAVSSEVKQTQRRSLITWVRVSSRGFIRDKWSGHAVCFWSCQSRSPC